MYGILYARHYIFGTSLVLNSITGMAPYQLLNDIYFQYHPISYIVVYVFIFFYFFQFLMNEYKWINN